MTRSDSAVPEVPRPLIDRALLALSHEFLQLRKKLAVKAQESDEDRRERIWSTARRIDVAEREVGALFLDTLEQCVDGVAHVPEPRVRWQEDNYGNVIVRGNDKLPIEACEICGEPRQTDKCHVIPRNCGGSNITGNLLFLCPTHHRCFDRGILTKTEWDRIDWRGRSCIARSFADHVMLGRQRLFWGDGQIRPNLYWSPCIELLRSWTEGYSDQDAEPILYLREVLIMPKQ